MSINTSPSFNSDNYSSINPSATTAGILQPQAANNADPASSRLSASGLVAGAVSQFQKFGGRVFNFNFTNQNGAAIDSADDWRVRISMQPATAAYFYNASNMVTKPLVETKGVIFPYTPQVQVIHSAKYGSQPLTHSNYPAYFYDYSEVQAITISGEFTVQNAKEGQYLMAAIHFFRSCTKMFYGNEALAGTPPPMVFLDGYGSSYFPHVPCVLQQFTHTMGADVDYIEVPIGVDVTQGPVNTNLVGIKTRLPTTSNISIQLQPVYSRTNIADNFTLTDYAQGFLTQNFTAPSGGFL